MDQIWIYVLLPAMSAVTCFYLLQKLFERNTNFEFFSLYICLTLININQALIYLTLPYSTQMAEYFADIYLITIYFFFTHLTLFSLALSGNYVGRRVHIILYSFPVLLTIFHLSGLMVDGYRHEGGILLHNDGALALCFDIFMIVSCFATVSTLWKNMRQNFDNKVIASKNIIALVAFIPLILVTLIIILLSRTPYVIPVVFIVPIVITYTAVAFYYLLRDRVIAVSVGVGFFLNRLKLANQLLEMKNNKDEIKSFTKAIEKQFIIEAMEVYGGDISATAEHLGMNHTTLRNKIKEYELTEKKSKSQATAI